MNKNAIERAKDQVDEIVDQTIANFINGLSTTIEKVLNDALLCTLGVTKKWGHYESTPNSLILKYLSAECEKELEQLVNKIFKKRLPTIRAAVDKLILGEYERIFTHCYRTAFVEAMKKEAENAAREKAKEIMEMIKVEQLISMDGEIENPEFAKNKTGEATLRRVAKRLAEADMKDAEEC